MKKIIIVWLSAIILISCNTDKAKVLIIGDSISLGYTPFLRKQLSGCSIYHNPGNAMHTRYSLENIDKWVNSKDWEMIHFNWGLWDMCYRVTEGENLYVKNKMSGLQDIPIKDYEENLVKLVKILKKTNAKLVFLTSTYVPHDEPGIKSEDVILYNNVAKEIMNKHIIPINDIYSKSKLIHQQYGISSADVHYTEKGYRAIAYLISEFINDKIVEM
jgi:hypothetical protein